MGAETSARLFADAARVIPGGVNSPVRAFSAVGGTPRFITNASGCRLTDADGNDYVDLVCSWGPMILGHAHPAVVEAVGGGKVGIRLSPVTPANDVVDANPQTLFEYVVEQLAPLGLAFIHIIEGATGGPRELDDRPFDYEALKAAYRRAGGKGAWMVNNGYDRALAEAALANGADIVAFGRPFIANPDLVERLKQNAPLNELNRDTLYGGGAKGYTDYPTLAG